MRTAESGPKKIPGKIHARAKCARAMRKAVAMIVQHKQGVAFMR